jgi:hypothetical protein
MTSRKGNSMHRVRQLEARMAARVHQWTASSGTVPVPVMGEA